MKVLNGERGPQRMFRLRIQPQSPHTGEAVAVGDEIDGVSVGRKVLFAISRSARRARSMADRCFSSREITLSMSFTQSPPSFCGPKWVCRRSERQIERVDFAAL
jgi:hypothetical protein